ncbi:MAG: FecR family protein [Paracoccaceae bacterium]
MSKSDEPNHQEIDRTREAVRIIRRLDESPDDAAARKDLEAFLKRGEPERKTYDRTLRALGKAETSLRRDRNKRYTFALLGGSLLTMALFWQPAKLAMIADFQSGRSVEEVVIASGDIVILDAASAIMDETDTVSRSVTLLTGAGYFEVDTSQRSFVVRVGDATVETLGTAFEVSRHGMKTHVSVASGAVRVRVAHASIEVPAGHRIGWTDIIDQQPELVEGDAIASWRDDLLFTDQLTVSEVAAIIDRRIPGPVIVLTDDLSQTVVSGRLDLSRPIDALRTLAATVDADVIAVSPLGVLIRP